MVLRVRRPLARSSRIDPLRNTRSPWTKRSLEGFGVSAVRFGVTLPPPALGEGQGLMREGIKPRTKGVMTGLLAVNPAVEGGGHGDQHHQGEPSP